MKQKRELIKELVAILPERELREMLVEWLDCDESVTSEE